MRRRLATLSLATTSLVVIALLVPLALLVREQASDAARAEAERQARSTAALVALTISLGTEATTVESAVGPLSPGTIVVTSEGVTVGTPLSGQGTLVEASLSLQATITGLVPGGWEIALPVIGRDESAVVDVFVTDETLSQGVREAWLLLGLLGLALVAVAVAVADRLGRTLVTPIRDLAGAAERMSEGDLTVRVEPGDPEEVREVGEAFNTLAARLDLLLAAEREGVADLSHRLRTPLTSLRLQAEGLQEPSERDEVLAQVERLEQSVDDLIVTARTRGGDVGRCDLNEVVAERAAFWAVLADEQNREMSVRRSGDALEVELTEAQVNDIVDVLVGNVFAHTEPGIGFEVATGRSDGVAWLVVSDEGPGLPGSWIGERGVSGAGSTGLGLDIARRTAEMGGGTLEMGDRPRGGAVVTVRFG